jgi:hypothetical protein
MAIACGAVRAGQTNNILADNVHKAQGSLLRPLVQHPLQRHRIQALQVFHRLSFAAASACRVHGNGWFGLTAAALLRMALVAVGCALVLLSTSTACSLALRWRDRVITGYGGNAR